MALELHSMNLEDDVDSLGSTTVTIGSWEKEADCCWAPALKTAELSFVVEVGLSESIRRLALDARGWLETTASPVKLVVIININRTNPEVTLQRWELFPGEYCVFTACRTTTLKVSRVDNLTFVTGESYKNGTTTTTSQLDIPFEKVVGRPPTLPLERDLVISEQKLSSFAEKIWRKQGLI